MNLEQHIHRLAEPMADRIGDILTHRNTIIVGKEYMLQGEVPRDEAARHLGFKPNSLNSWIGWTDYLVTGKRNRYIHGMSVLYMQLIGKNLSRTGAGKVELVNITGASEEQCGEALTFIRPRKSTNHPPHLYSSKAVRKNVVNPTFLEALDIEGLLEIYQKILK